MNILIIDDEKESVETLIERLLILEHNVKLIQDLDTAFDELSNPIYKYRYDLALIDYRFTDNSSKRFENGSDLCSELSKLDIFTPLILFTGTGADAKIIKKVLGDYGICYFFQKRDFDKDAEGCLNKTIEVPGYRRVRLSRSLTIEKELKQYFHNLEQYEIDDFHKEADKGIEADWSQSRFKVLLDVGEYSLIDLLNEPGKLNKNEQVNVKVLEFIKFGNRFVSFAKTFHDDVISQYDEYIYLPINKFEKLQEIISARALDYYLNIISIYNQIEDKNNNDLKSIYLNKRNRGLKATNKCYGKTKDDIKAWDNFVDKLILRRVALSVISHLDLDKFFTINELALCLRDGGVILDKVLTPSDIRSVFYTGLGLTMPVLNDFQRRDGLVLNEEKNWVNTIGKEAQSINMFLEKYEITRKISNGTNYFDDNRNLPPENGFTDLTEFEEYLQQIKNVKSVNFEKVVQNIKTTKDKCQPFAEIYFEKWFPIEIAHFGAGLLGLGLVLPLMDQLSKKIIIVNRYSDEWKKRKDWTTIELSDNNGGAYTFKLYNDDLPEGRKKEIIQEWENSVSYKLMVVSDDKELIADLLKNVEHISTSLKSEQALNWCKSILNNIDFNNLITIYPFENDRLTVDNFYENLSDEKFIKSILIADRVCSFKEFDDITKKLLVYTEKYGNVVIHGKNSNNLFAQNPKISGVGYIYCEDLDEFNFYYNKKYRLLNSVHASLAIFCYSKLMEKGVPRDERGKQHINVLQDITEIKRDINQIIKAEIIKLIVTTERRVLDKIYPNCDNSQIYEELEVYSDSIIERFQKMPDSLDRVLKIDDLPRKYKDRISELLDFYRNQENIKLIHELGLKNITLDIETIQNSQSELMSKVIDELTDIINEKQ